MMTQVKYATVALAVAAAFSAPAFANGESDGGIHDTKWTFASNVSRDYTSTENETEVELSKKVDISHNVSFEGGVSVNGGIGVNASSLAIVDDKQINYANTDSNTLLTNDAKLEGNALQGATGSVGANVAAGDNNQQANAAALASADADFVFGSADAEAFARQDGEGNSSYNAGVINNATVQGNALAGASGNIGLNVVSGSYNQQKNDLAVSSAHASLANASLAVKQMSDHNTTNNDPFETQVKDTLNVSLSTGLSGGYFGVGGGRYSGSTSGTTSGQSYQANNIYPDTWAANPAYGSSNQHANSPALTGHFDIDSQTQGAVQNPSRPGVGGLAFDNTGSYSGSERGNLGFIEAGGMALSGASTGTVEIMRTVFQAGVNTATLGGNALQGARGNIGVNIASGVGNQQYNGLALAATQVGTGGSIPGGGE